MPTTPPGISSVGGVRGIKVSTTDVENFYRFIEFFSSDSSIDVSGDNVTKKIDFKIPSTSYSWAKIETTINDSETKAVDTIAMADFRSIKYLITVWVASLSKTKFIEMTVIRPTDTTLSDSVCNILGGGFGMTLAMEIDGTDAKLNVGNTSGSTANIEVARLVIGS